MSLGAKLPERHPKTIIGEDYEAMSQICADKLAEVLREKSDALICLPAGSTAIRTLEILVEKKRAGSLDMREARFVQLDEWLDIQDESQNCAAFLQKHFYGPAEIDPARIRNFDVHAENPLEECRRMDDWLAENGPIDCMLLGLGMNGHVGLNEPGISWDQGAIVVDLADTTMRVGQKYFEEGQSLSRGITLGMRHVFAAKMVILQVSGANKADIVAEMYGTQPHEKLPGTVMKLLSGGLVVLDQEAAAKIVDVKAH